MTQNIEHTLNRECFLKQNGQHSISLLPILRRANKSADLFDKINNISNWETVEINFKNYEVASIPFTQFYGERNYRLVIMREKSSDAQIDMFTQDAYIYRSILTNDHESTEKEVIEYYNARGASEKISMK